MWISPTSCHLCLCSSWYCSSVPPRFGWPAKRNPVEVSFAPAPTANPKEEKQNSVFAQRLDKLKEPSFDPLNAHYFSLAPFVGQGLLIFATFLRIKSFSFYRLILSNLILFWTFRISSLTSQDDKTSTKKYLIWNSFYWNFESNFVKAGNKTRLDKVYR